MDLGILITGAVGMVTTIVSGFTSYIFTRKKYISEVDSNYIKNMEKSLEFYQKITESNEKKLEHILKENENMSNELVELKSTINSIVDKICMNTTCVTRYIDPNILNYINK